MTIITMDTVRARALPDPAALHGVTAGFAAVRREWTLWRARRRLAMLDEAGLHDLGLGRSEIAASVRSGRQRAA